MWHIIVNPVAGGGLALRTLARIEAGLKAMGVPYLVEKTERPGHATEIARSKAEAGVERLLCIGGDGTLYEVANGICGTQTALGIIPSGTGNDFCRTLGVPKDAMAALKVAERGSPRRVDLGRMGDRSFLNVAGVGFDVSVLQRLDKYRFLGHGQLPYLVAVLDALFSYRPIELELELDGQYMKKQVLLVAIANGQYFGGGMQVAPEADPWDGYLDVVIVDHVPRWKIPVLLPLFIRGQGKKVPQYHSLRAKSLSVLTEGLFYNVDGEVIAMPPTQFSVHHGGMSVLVIR